MLNSSWYKDKDYEFGVLDDWEIMVDYSEILVFLWLVYDFLSFQFPDCPTEWADCIRLELFCLITFTPD
ncbi:hypothetical protein [Pedobacter sp. ok626]|uniref:hypothetical protein n=1 Tax=Pedobacter sp. ok626 TaxID=1761882 RepID=UPI000B87F7A6|nr:hypothetical protein [Pedobacter sp. ok626]